MPLKPCRKNGKPGTKYGNRGTCYTGKNQKSKARKQARAMHARGYRGK